MSDGKERHTIRNYFRKYGAVGFGLHLFAAAHIANLAVPYENLQSWYTAPVRGAYHMFEAITPKFLEPVEGTFHNTIDELFVDNDLEKKMEAGVATDADLAEFQQDRARAQRWHGRIPDPIENRGRPINLLYVGAGIGLAEYAKRRHCKRRVTGRKS